MRWIAGVVIVSRAQAIRQAHTGRLVVSALAQGESIETHGRPTLPDELVSLYEERDQSRRETIWLMSHAPHDGRPQARRHADGSPISGTVNAQETRASDRWKETGHKVFGSGLPATNECVRSFDGGVTWELAPVVQRERKVKRGTVETVDTVSTFETDYMRRGALLGSVGSE